MCTIYQSLICAVYCAVIRLSATCTTLANTHSIVLCD